jgi:hypothetical protein
MLTDTATFTTPIAISRRYRLLAPAGTGGMGQVSRALARLTGQVVALERVLARVDERIAALNALDAVPPS